MGLFRLDLQEPEFRLHDGFLDRYVTRDVAWGPVGYVTYKRTYSRTKPDSTSEEWWETVRRVVEGTYRIQQRHCAYNNVPWIPQKATESAEDMFDRIFNFKFTPPGRGLWMMGTEYIEQHGSAALNNCAFVSTKDLAHDFAEPFCFLMDMSMLGVGVGGDTAGAGSLAIDAPKRSEFVEQIGDNREAWIDAVRVTLRAYTGSGILPTWDYSLIRPYGSDIKGFGGKAAGPDPLRTLLEDDIPKILDPLVGKKITSGAIVDLFNVVGKCVVAGNVRRSAEIMFGQPSDEEFLDLKNPELHAEEMESHRWASNNSIFAQVGMDYAEPAARTGKAGEPGYIWLDNIRRFGRMADPPDNRDHRAAGSNPCVPGFTPILTREGYRNIENLVGQTVDVWNGCEWSTVEPRVTGHDQRLVKVELSDGSYLHCTEAHKWMLADGSRVKAADLQKDDPLAKFDMPVVETGEVFEHAYEHGFFCGDGQINQSGSRGALLYGDKKQLFSDAGPEDAYGRRWIGFPRSIPEKGFVPEDARLEDRLAWFAGLCDADGTLTYNPNSISLSVSSVNKHVLDRVRLMLTTVGVQAKIGKMFEPMTRLMPDGKGGYKEYECQESWRLLINATDTYKLACLGLPCRRLKIEKLKPQRDARRFVRVVSVVPYGIEPTVYCFTEPKNNTGTFNGVVTGQCVEQTLESYELCCLVETFPAHHDSYEDYERTLKKAYLYAKTVTLLPTHNPKTNAVMMRNRRIGTSQSGIVQNFAKIGRRRHFTWCDQGYQYIQKLDRIYSDWLAVPTSIKTTSVKPSGTVSKLCGATSGIHYPPAEFYVQRIRFGFGSPLLKEFERAGYKLEPCVYTPNTMVVEIPVHEKHFYKAETDVSLWEQIGNAVAMQKWWADNQVSCTVKFDNSNPEKAASEIAAALELHQDELKGISFLPHAHGYKQPPWEPISEDEYNMRVDGIEMIRTNEATNDTVDKFCNGDKCDIVV